MTTLFDILKVARATGDAEKHLAERVQKLEQQLADAKDRRDELTLQTRPSALHDAAFEECKRILYKGLENPT